MYSVIRLMAVLHLVILLVAAPAQLMFKNSANTEKARFTQDGNLNINTTTSRGKLTVEGYGNVYSTHLPYGSSTNMRSAMDVRITSVLSGVSSHGVRSNIYVPPDNNADYYNTGVQGYSLLYDPFMGELAPCSGELGANQFYASETPNKRFYGVRGVTFPSNVESIYGTSNWLAIGVFGFVHWTTMNNSKPVFAGYFYGAKSYFSAPVIVGGADNTSIGTHMLWVNGTAWSTGSWGSSDARFKKNIMPVTGALDKVSRLNGVQFEWRTEEYPDRGFDAKPRLGLIAQDVESVLPQMVSEDGKGYKAIGYDQMSALLIEAVKELKKNNETLQDENRTLKSRLDQLETRMAR